MENPAVEFISDCFIKPKHLLPESNQVIFLSPFDLALAFVHYMQKGLLFAKPPSFDQDQMQDFLLKLKKALSLSLVHFYPLAGRLETVQLEEDPRNLAVYVDCNKGPGARFVHASVALSLYDIVSPTDVPSIVKSFFDHEDVINYDCGDQSLLTIQVTELTDGIFIGCSMNHMVGDGTSLWHFLTSVSHMCKSIGSGTEIARLPTYDKLFPEGIGPLMKLPFVDQHDDNIISISRDGGQPKMVIRERIFHFSSESVTKLKAKANAEFNSAGTMKSSSISSLQALSAHIWRCITRARNLPSDETTMFTFIVNYRSTLVPPVSENNFGNHILPAITTVTCGELLENSLGWAALLLHELVNSKTDKTARDYMESWKGTPIVARLGVSSDASNTSSGILLGGSQRFNIYGAEFGLGKAIVVRSGSANKFDGKITVYPGTEGGGSMDLEICLAPHVMTSLEADNEFMDTVSL